MGREKNAKAAATALALLALSCLTLTAQAATRKHAELTWYASWAASPMDLHSFPSSIIAPTIDTVSNQTARQIVTISRGGSRLRVRFSNEFGTTPLRIGAASLGYQAPGAMDMRRIALTFSGVGAITVSPGAPIFSDPVLLNVPSGANLEISLYLPDRTVISTIHLLGLQRSEISGPGDYTMADTLPDAVPFDFTEMRSGHKFIARPFLSEVDVADRVAARTVIALGNSITDGQGSSIEMKSTLAGRSGQTHCAIQAPLVRYQRGHRRQPGSGQRRRHQRLGET